MTREEPTRGGVQRVHSLDLDDVFDPQYVKEVEDRKANPNTEEGMNVSHASSANYDAEGEGDFRVRQGGGPMGASALGRSMSGFRSGVSSGGRKKTRMASRVSQSQSGLQTSANLMKLSLSYVIDTEGEDYVPRDSRSVPDGPDILGSTTHTTSTVHTTQTARLDREQGRSRMKRERVAATKLLDTPSSKAKPKPRKKVERKKSGGGGDVINGHGSSRGLQHDAPKSPTRRRVSGDTKSGKSTPNPKGRSRANTGGGVSPKSSNGKKEERPKGGDRHRSRSPSKRPKSPAVTTGFVPSPPLLSPVPVAAEASTKSPRKAPSPVPPVMTHSVPEEDPVKSNENIPPKRLPPTRKPSPKDRPPSRHNSDEKKKASRSKPKAEKAVNIEQTAPLSPTRLRKPSIHVPDEEEPEEPAINSGIPLEIHQEDDPPRSPLRTPSILMPPTEQEDVPDSSTSADLAKPATDVPVEGQNSEHVSEETDADPKALKKPSILVRDEEKKQELKLPELKRDPESAFVEVASRDSKGSRLFEVDSDSDQEDGGTVLQFDPTQSDHVIRVNQVAKTSAEYDIDNMDGSVSHGEIKEINDPISDALSLQGQNVEKTQIFDFLESDPDIGEDRLDDKSLDGPSGGEEDPEDLVRRSGRRKTPFGLDYPSGEEGNLPSPRSPRSKLQSRRRKGPPRKGVKKTLSFDNTSGKVPGDGSRPGRGARSVDGTNKYASEDDAGPRRRPKLKKKASVRSRESAASSYKVNSLDFPGIGPSEKPPEDSKGTKREFKKKPKKPKSPKKFTDSDFDPLKGPSGHEPTGYGRTHPDNYAASCDEVDVRRPRRGKKPPPPPPLVKSASMHEAPLQQESSLLRPSITQERRTSSERNFIDTPLAEAFEFSTAYESEVDASPTKTPFLKQLQLYFTPRNRKGRRNSPSATSDREDGGSVSGTSVSSRPRFFGGGRGGGRKATKGHALLLDDNSSESSDGGFLG